MIVLIPAYKPDQRLIQLAQDLRALGDFQLLIVNDGSGPAYEPIFDQMRALGAQVLVHDVNKGKGRALKTGFAYAMTQQNCGGVVTADADGQHLPKDIAAVAKRLSRCDDNTFVLGSRGFDETTPLRSRLGNCITRSVFLWASGNRVCDTQTGLRGFPEAMLPWLTKIGGDRYEYEMDVLLAGARAGYQVQQVLIDTVYFDENKGSHFFTVRDAARVYRVIGRYTKGAIAASAAELILFCILCSVFAGKIASVFWWVTVCFALSRLLALLVKYALIRQKPVRYERTILAVRTAVSWGLLLALMGPLCLPAFWAKLISSLVPFVLTLWVLNAAAKKYE